MMRRSILCLRPVLGLLAAIALAGCAMEGGSAAAGPASAVQMTQEQGGRFIVLAGPKFRHDAPFLGIANTNFALLRSFIDTRSGEVAHQLYVEDSYSGAERVWNAARLASGVTLRLVSITKSQITCDYGCAYAEEFAAALPDALLRGSRQGLSVVFTTRSGITKPISVPADFVAKQLAAVAEARAARPAVVASPPPASAPPR